MKIKEIIHKDATFNFTIGCLIFGCLTGCVIATLILINYAKI